MKVRFIRQFRDRNIGDIADVSDQVAASWIDKRIAVEVEEKAVEAPPRDKAMRRPRNKKGVDVAAA